MKDLLILAAWLYYNVGAFLLIFRGDHILKPSERLRAWALWPFRSWPLPGWMNTGYSEEEFYSLPIRQQRSLLGLRDGQNPSAPSFFRRPTPVRVSKTDQS